MASGAQRIVINICSVLNDKKHLGRVFKMCIFPAKSLETLIQWVWSGSQESARVSVPEDASVPGLKTTL